MRTIALALAGCVLLLSGCLATERTGIQPMELRVVEGSARIVHEGKTNTVKTRSALEIGDRVVVRKDSVAEVRLAGARTFELTAGQLTVQGRDEVSHRSGQLLVVVEDPVTVTTGSFDVLADEGSFRVDRGISTRVGNYAGEPVNLRGAASRLSVPPLRQAVVAGSSVPLVPDPLRVSPADRWDRRFLSEVIETDEALANFARGLEAQLGGEEGLSFFQKVLPGVDSGFVAPYIGNRRADLLIGLVLAISSEAHGGSTAGRFASAFDLWSSGASWGLVAFEFKVQRDSIFARLLEVIQRAGLEIVGARGRPAGTGDRRPQPQPSPGGGPGRAPSPSPSPSPRPSPSPSPSPPGPIPSPVASIIDDLLGADSAIVPEVLPLPR